MYILDTNTWYVERIIFIVAGGFVIGGLSLVYLTHTSFWLLLPLLVSLMLINFGITGYCPLAILLAALGCPSKLAKNNPKK